MEIKKGNIYWINFSPATGSELKDMHPAVVVQATHINNTAINTVVVVGITSNIRLKDIKGNVYIKKNHFGLKKDSVINISQIFTVDKIRLEKYIGTLPLPVLEEVYFGLDLLFGK